jgi:hypothetical protein
LECLSKPSFWLMLNKNKNRNRMHKVAPWANRANSGISGMWIWIWVSVWIWIMYVSFSTCDCDSEPRCESELHLNWNKPGALGQSQLPPEEGKTQHLEGKQEQAG